ncbi:GNAT family N-acetyltransferase [Elizabethkingia anophelis]|uniref:GNAT family N-acetyltransferase n=2 Tax=Elizabethkingia anophelis TaxID=1117645 RepID=A0AAE4P0A3_9FLAO|nr:GNAT family N-acetyltransferase [Elizabethkingia anophelis]MCT3832552.1 GNAT family N-acetyltransferase [Elizabethkingia anophelis]MCT3918626.1 GNAT family N-acetyltransferase [Elizabethkingia anophelis]MCT3950980.1 GNAT family N-acetyltransferase [Elizabethkingia anophelis]MCT3954523.1 GNAT family N-acetyltransferase [Elizabethkingia anophelis]
MVDGKSFKEKHKILEMEIRVAEKNDLSTIQRMCADTIAAVCSTDYNQDQIEVWISGIENTPHWNDNLLGQYILVAEYDGEITGFISLKDGYYIDYLYIHADYQHQGIAKRLYKAIEEKALLEKQSLLMADVSITAKPFFERIGFKIIRQQQVKLKGIELTNYKMEKSII